MYFVVVALTMFVLPIASVIVERALHPETALVLLIGRWFVFWSVGVRLALAGARQTLQPAFTLNQIFHISGSEALPIVRELGFANVCAGVLGLISLFAPSFVIPAALYAAIYYGLAGVGHVFERDRSANENLAMASDVFIFVALAIFLLGVAVRG